MLVKITAWARNVDEMGEGVHVWLPLCGTLVLWPDRAGILIGIGSQVHTQSTGISLVMSKGSPPATLILQLKRQIPFQNRIRECDP